MKDVEVPIEGLITPLASQCICLPTVCKSFGMYLNKGNISFTTGITIHDQKYRSYDTRQESHTHMNYNTRQKVQELWHTTRTTQRNYTQELQLQYTTRSAGVATHDRNHIHTGIIIHDKKCRSYDTQQELNTQEITHRGVTVPNSKYNPWYTHICVVKVLSVTTCSGGGGRTLLQVAKNAETSQGSGNVAQCSNIKAVAM